MNEDTSHVDPPTVPTEEKAKETEGLLRLKSLRTYQGDVEEIMAKNHTSVITVAVAEQARKQREDPRPPQLIHPTKAKGKSFIVTGMLFMALGIGTVGAVYYVQSRINPLRVQAKDSILTYSNIYSFDATETTPYQFGQIISQRKQSVNLKVNEIFAIDPQSKDKKQLLTETFLSLLTPNIPQALARSFGEKYMFGIYSYDTNAPFIILSVADFGASYSGMLKWENKMIADLGELFDIPSFQNTSLYTFKDEALKNKDLRIAVDRSGKTVLVYSFIDKNTLIITVNENVFTSLLHAYQTTQTVR